MKLSFFWSLLALGVAALGLGLYVFGQKSDSSIGSGKQTTVSQNGVQDVDLSKATEKQVLEIAGNKTSQQRLEAILVFAKRPPQDLASVVPALAKILLEQSNDPHGLETCKIAVGIVFQKIGPKGAEFLRSFVESSDALEIATGCSALKEMGGAENFVPKMKSWLESDVSSDRQNALYALQGSNKAAIQLLPQIAGAMKDADFNVQSMACRVVVNLGPEAIDVAPNVLELFKKGNPSARSWAAHALGAIGPNTELDTAKLLSGNLNAFLQIEKQRTLYGLARMGTEAVEVAPDVREAMLDEKRRVMHDAAYTTWRLTGEKEEPLKILAQSLKQPEIVNDTLELIGKMEGSAAPLVKQITELLVLDEDSESPTEQAIIALGNIGPEAKSAIGSLEKIIADPRADALIRYYAEEAISKIQSSAGK